ncbi:hypothetical protein Salat_1582900 [Sesamum alatum]|uniref:Uncharacterized protein n=1 Tax=Sesamum alatum TaxID=300844 RepID=A0AAE1YDB7_9LAMI|nr:hypothetical protein Salat_1582900 [Sesamum alatum]
MRPVIASMSEVTASTFGDAEELYRLFESSAEVSPGTAVGGQSHEGVDDVLCLFNDVSYLTDDLLHLLGLAPLLGGILEEISEELEIPLQLLHIASGVIDQMGLVKQ